MRRIKRRHEKQRFQKRTHGRDGMIGRGQDREHMRRIKAEEVSAKQKRLLDRKICTLQSQLYVEAKKSHTSRTRE